MVINAWLSILCFCFYNQKTAYEMRIINWSSDVCPSDLVQCVATAAVRDAANGPDFIAAAAEAGLDIRLLSGEEEAEAAGHGVLSAIPDAHGIADIGRESCRERGCPPVRHRLYTYPDKNKKENQHTI